MLDDPPSRVYIILCPLKVKLNVNVNKIKLNQYTWKGLFFIDPQIKGARSGYIKIKRSGLKVSKTKGPSSIRVIFSLKTQEKMLPQYSCKFMVSGYVVQHRQIEQRLPRVYIFPFHESLTSRGINIWLEPVPCQIHSTVPDKLNILEHPPSPFLLKRYYHTNSS